MFDATERDPDEELRFQFEAVTRMPDREKEAIRTFLDAMIVKSQVEGALERVNRPAAKAKARATKAATREHAKA